MSFESNNLIEISSEKMQHNIVIEKIGQSLCYELYDETSNKFIIACVMDKYMQKGILIFTTLKDCHLRKYNDIISMIDESHPDFIARMARDWISGLKFSLFNRSSEIICDIRFMSSIFERLPIAFKVKIYNTSSTTTQDLLQRSLNGSNNKIYNEHLSRFNLMDFLCLTDTSCFHDDDNSVTNNNNNNYHHTSNYNNKNNNNTSKRTSTTTYSSIDSTLSNGDLIFLKTKKPTWNKEIKHWMHNFGGRVKVPSNLNFLVTETTPEDYETSIKNNYHIPIPRYITDNNNNNNNIESVSERVCIRHGKTSANAYILDCRAPVSLLVSFATMCATHIAKPFVKS